MGGQSHLSACLQALVGLCQSRLCGPCSGAATGIFSLGPLPAPLPAVAYLTCLWLRTHLTWTFVSCAVVLLHGWLWVGAPQTAFPAANGGAAGTMGGQGRCVGEHSGTGPLETRRVPLELAPTGTSLVGLREHQEAWKASFFYPGNKV